MLYLFDPYILYTMSSLDLNINFKKLKLIFENRASTSTPLIQALQVELREYWILVKYQI